MVELADIFRQYGSAYQQQFNDQLLPSHQRALSDIMACRTPVLGGQMYACQSCGTTQYSYHSCQNRHCPKCQHQMGQQWLARQQDLLLSVPYFFLTFTLPEGLRSLVRRQQKTLYNLLFQASAAATQQLAHDPRFIGGQIGLLGVLHTWGRNLVYHPHVHYLVPAGGLATEGQNWLPARHNFLLPVKALSKLFQAKFRDGLKQAGLFSAVDKAVWRQPWVVHCQPVGNGLTALKYLAPYIFRVAISNRRILKVSNDRVSFRYRATETGKLRRCTLSVQEFIRRFLQHVLPRGFVKVRYYGFFAPGLRHRLQFIRQQLGQPVALPPEDASDTAVPSTVSAPIPCHNCGQPMRRRQRLWPRSRYPPGA